MSASFYAWAGLMVAIAALVVGLMPRLWRRNVDGETTLDWLRLRQTELQRSLAAARDEDDRDAEAKLLTDAELRVLDDLSPAELKQRNLKGDTSQPSASISRGQMWFPSLATLIAVAALPFALYHYLGAIEDVRISEALATLQSADREEVEQLLKRIETRSEARPENADYLSLLGEYYTASEAYAKALTVYENLLTLYPESAEVLARAAQAEYLLEDRTLTERARRRSEAALAVDPNQRTALGTLGMAAFEAQDYSAALTYWERLITFETPGSPGYQMMSSVIAEARSRGGIGVPDRGTPDIALEGVTVSVSAPADADIPDSATIFVLARPAGSEQRMPTAVVRRSGADLPFTLRLDDGNSMAGQKVSELSRVNIEVQVSPTGQPGRSNATWVASASNVVPSEEAAVALTLDPMASSDGS